MSIQTQKYARPSDQDNIGPRSVTPFQTQTTHQSAHDIPCFGTARPSSHNFLANGLLRYTSCRMVVLTVRLFLFTRTSGPRYPPNCQIRTWRFVEKTFRETEYFLQTKVCQVQVTVDLPTFCLVTISSVESKDLELELEQPKKIAIQKK